MYKKHTHLAPGTRHLAGVLEQLPNYLEDDEVMIACYAHEGDEIVVIGYYKDKGHYEDRIAFPHGDRSDISSSESIFTQKAREVCGRGDCWAGGDTGDFYRKI